VAPEQHVKKAIQKGFSAIVAGRLCLELILLEWM
jgi:hypothetical protein